jgi:hypothetical protein
MTDSDELTINASSSPDAWSPLAPALFLLPRTDAIPFPAAAGRYCRWLRDGHLPRHGAFCSYPGTAV